MCFERAFHRGLRQHEQSTPHSCGVSRQRSAQRFCKAAESSPNCASSNTVSVAAAVA